MRHNIAACVGLGVLVATGSCQAQVDYNAIQAGTLLDGKGIRIGAFIKPLPLPQGHWLVVSRNDEALGLTGGRAEMSPPTTGSVTLTLKSTDAGNGIAAMLVGFTPDSTPVRWLGEYCPNKQFPIVDNLGTEATSIASACAEGQWYASGFRNWIASAASQPQKNIQTIFGGLTPYAKEMPNAHAAIRLSARRDRGRSLNYAVYARLPANFMPSGGRFETQVREWVHTAGLALLDTVNNRESAIPAFPPVEEVPLASPFPNEAPAKTPPAKPIALFPGTQG
ncbi:hypothetical protein [Rhodoferax saidenbachensis]|uniref:Uncharacterized protein n=1 Tax=Rhodoferax saidenbachensis TaxID=1484693 RepID=A0A1P8K549_9BURK|nr:hypothetical protein [Rhodoferax saidenbachensis]APW41144.1 hypothetical protein RS694_00340 [Rhodoferax saidenbachensis]